MSDWELIKQYRAGSEPAFAVLMKRHVDWVYSAALRRVREHAMAEDVTQATFIALSKSPIKEGVVVTAWIFRTMMYISNNALRSQRCRTQHERNAAQDATESIEATEDAWQEIVPQLDVAVASLSRADRDAILLRFYQQLSLSEAAGILGITEEGVRKRVARSVDKLRVSFSRAGIDQLSVAALTGKLSSELVSRAPDSTTALTPTPRSTAWAHQARAMGHARWIGLTTAAAVIAIVVASGAFWWMKQPVPALTAMPSALATTAPATAPSTRPTTLNLDEILAGVRRAETSFTNLYIKDFHTTVDTRGPGETEWKKSPTEFQGSAWLDDRFDGKTRIYYAKRVQKWINGAAPYYINETDYAWDGKRYCETHVATYGNDGRMRRDPTAVLRTERLGGLDLYDRYWTGSGYTLQYRVTELEGSYPVQPRRILSQRIADMAKIERPELAEERINGIRTLRVRLVNSEGRGIIAYWFAPDCGFAIVKDEMIVNTPKHAYHEWFEVSDLREVAKGVWFPMKTEMVRRDIGERGGSYVRYHFAAADAVANAPQFDEKIFSPSPPVGYVISDDTQNEHRTAIVLDDGTFQEIGKGERLPRIRADVPRRPDAPAK